MITADLYSNTIQENNRFILQMPDFKDNFVVIAGSGRSGTTWLGSLLDTYEHAEYYYEICHFPELDFDSPDLLKRKHPLIGFSPVRPVWLRKTERLLMEKLPQSVLSTTSMRLHQPLFFDKHQIDTCLFKIVKLFSFAMNLQKYKEKFDGRMKVIHIIRNPYSQLVSEIRQHEKNVEHARQHFSMRMHEIINNNNLVKYHDLGKRYLDGDWIEHMAFVWWVSNEIMIENKLLSTYVLTYEELCRKPFEITQDVFSFLGWPMSEQTKKQIEATTTVENSETGTWSIKKNAEQAMNRWRNEIKPSDYNRISQMLSSCQLMAMWNREELLL